MTRLTVLPCSFLIVVLVAVTCQAGGTKYPLSIRTLGEKGIWVRLVPSQPWPVVQFPFPEDHPVRCTQGHAHSNPGHSHFDDCCTFAVDLCSPLDSSAGNICAANDGVAYVFNSCKERSTSATSVNDSKCGHGFGNNVRILNSSGLYTFYAHLSSVSVKNGQRVKAGQVIGVEGHSGRAGQRHLHFSVHKVKSPTLPTDIELPGEQTPFIIRVRYGDRKHAENVCSFDLRLCKTSADGPLIYGCR